MISGKGKYLIESGWRMAGIKSAIHLGSKNLVLCDPFHDINPLVDEKTTESQQLRAICGLISEEKQIGYPRKFDERQCCFRLVAVYFQSLEEN